ncbi:MAG: chromosome segregation protein SMC [Acidobacteria bacterium]|nr:chromosome segregation protein SMC [Acidobacteriota bacterium]
MLKLERLELSGFKSFVDPVSVDFHGGITAIVGPNGCGKSNLSDGMSWVLGEQSAKTLRGGRMEDVIFNGSDSRRPLGMAEAILTLRTDQDFPRSENGEIVIGRRVLRSGESQYRLNGRTVRLKEIKDLLMDTGLGIRAYSVIEQGKIGMILSSKPQERRRLLEEAAGITRYKARKRVAEVKLEEAMANLLRLDDVIAEVERALRSLKRQAGAAKRYKEQEVLYRDLLRQVLTGRWAVLHARLEEVKKHLEETTAVDAELAAALSRDEASLAAGREALERQSEVLGACHQRRSELAALIEGRQEFLKSSRQTLQEIGERVAAGIELARRRDAEGEEHKKRLAEVEERTAELRRERDDAAAAVEEDRAHIAGAEKELRQAEARVASVRSDLLRAGSEVSGLRNRKHQGQIEQERANTRRHHLKQEIDQVDGEITQMDEALAVAADKVAELETSLAANAEQLATVSAALETTLQEEGKATSELRRLEDERTRAEQRRDILEQLERAHAERRSSLEEALAASGYPEPDYLASRLEAVAGWERCLDFFLGELTDAVILDPEEAATSLALHLHGRVRSAGATLLRPWTAAELPPADPAEAAGPGDDPAVVLSLAQALGLPRELSRALPPGYLVESADDAERLARSHAGVVFVSREGIWAEGGLLHVEGDREIPGVLARERELADLAEALPRLEESCTAAARRIEELVRQRAEHAREKNRLEGAGSQLRQDLAVSRARRQDVEGRRKRLADQREKVREELDGADTRVAGLAERQRGIEASLEQATGRETALAEDLERAQADVERAKGEREGLRTQSAGRAGRLEVLEERLEALESEGRRLQREIEEGERQATLWRDEGTRLERRRSELETARTEADAELARALQEQQDADDQVILEQEKLDDLRTDLRTLEERIAACRRRRDEVRGAIEEQRVRQASLGQDAEHLRAGFEEHFESELPPAPEELPGNLAALEAELATTKATLDRLGPVNVLAMEEFEEQEERHGFLVTQRADVADSVTRLRQTIREINATSSERFLATFEEVNVTFGEVFQRLFRGGEAEMRLMDEEDVLESGIEIVARPPGKRLQNIQLMSGGEKALTAIALLFALFRTKPSPFCILDEVDAPLDDANTVRFVETLQLMAKDTQFLVITHNKLTMEVASTLYGVTMEERGVSKLVSVEMENVQPVEQERATA